MPHMHPGGFRARHSGSALFALAFLVGLILPQLLLMPPAQAAQATSSTATPAVPLGRSDPHEMETFLDGVINKQMQANHIPGASIAVVKDGRLFFAKGYGAADLQAGKPVSAQTTVFRIGSVSKLFTATAVLQLVEQGKLDLHADINTYLKTFQVPATYPQPITLAHLLTHTAGFEARETGLQAARSTDDLEPLGTLLARHMPARVRPPGEVTAYSNYGYALAGYIVEQVSGMPYAQYVRQHIFQPLGMRSSTFRQPLETDLAAELSQGYSYSNGRYHAGPFEPIPMSPAGAMSATATDMANFMIAQLQGGRLGNMRILQDATTRLMQTRHFTNDPRVPGGMAYGFEEHYRNGQRLLLHPGGITNFYSLLALLPDQHVGVFIAYNSMGGAADYLSYPFLQAFLDHYDPVAKEPTHPPLAGSAERMRQITGTYWGTDRSYTTWEKLIDSLVWAMSVSDKGNGRLEITWLLAPLSSGLAGRPITFVEVTPWVFHQVDGQESVVFRPDSGGMRMMRGSYPVMAFDKVAWYASPFFVLALTVACLLIFLSALLLWPLAALRTTLGRRTRKVTAAQQVGEGHGDGAQPSQPEAHHEEHHEEQSRTRATLRRSQWNLPRLAIWLAGVVSALNVVLVLGVLFFLFQQLTATQADYYSGVPPLLTVLFTLALISTVLTVGVVALAIPAWRARFWSTWQRIHYSLVALAALALTWQVLFWNLLGFRA